MSYWEINQVRPCKLTKDISADPQWGGCPKGSCPAPSKRQLARGRARATARASD